ncbi:MAG: rhodanese-like domain-containing protein [Cyclobacteriaceae bacterium]|nr:rhodanese-like domain-containing protein [Cyclobacteriaceae bacterium]
MKHILSLSLLLVLAACGGKPSADASLLGPADFQTALASTPQAVLIDVRTPEEFTGGHIDQAVNIDFKSPGFAEAFSAYDKTTPLFVYCQKGGRSGKAAAQLKEMGFKVTDLQGGFSAWQSAGLPAK